MAQKAHRYVYPDKKLTFQYTTSSTSLRRSSAWRDASGGRWIAGSSPAMTAMVGGSQRRSVLDL
jgi:hypothetical protein